jgi:Sugar-transfer associated ATP-grasp
VRPASSIAASWDRPARVARRLSRAAEAHGAPLWRVGLRAAQVRRRGWRLGEAASFGLLDPGADLASFDWAIPATEMERLQEALNPEDAARLAEDKRNLAGICARHRLPAARQAALLERAGGVAATAAVWAAALEREAPDELVIKPVDGHRGLGLRVLSRAPGGAADLEGRVLSWEALARELARERWPGFLVQERLRPHPELEAMSGSAVVHTLRMVTLRSHGEPPRLVASRLRIPAGHLPVDSFRAGRSGNLVAEVRPDGSLALPFGPRPSGFGLDPVPRHPLSGVPLEGVRVPGWEEARALALRAAEAFAPLRTVGLDIAPTDRGPVLVEANAWWRWLPNPRGGADPAFAALREAAAG